MDIGFRIEIEELPRCVPRQVRQAKSDGGEEGGIVIPIQELDRRRRNLVFAPLLQWSVNRTPVEVTINVFGKRRDTVSR